jgi:hypothetical protein
MVSHVLAEVSKGIYGLKQAGLLAQQKLKLHLKEHGYTPLSFLHFLLDQTEHSYSSFDFIFPGDDSHLLLHP